MTTTTCSAAAAAALRLPGLLGVLVAVTLFVGASPARASLTTSEAEEVRGYVAGDAHPDRVRALVARPDLTADESAAVMTTALAGIPIDDRRITYLEEVVRGAPSPATRPVLAVATVRGLLAHADALYAQHPADLDHAVSALAEIGRAYGFVANEVSGADTSMTDTSRADVGHALCDHLGRNAGFLHLDVKVAPAVARLRAIAAVALYDSLPDGPTRRVDAADKLFLSGPRRAAILETGVLVLDAGGSDDRIAEVRAALDRLPGAREGAEAVFVGDARATFHAHAAVVCTDDATGPLGEARSPWGGEADPPAVPALTMAVAQGLANVAVARALDRRPGLRVQVDGDGGAVGVATVAAMLAVDAPRTVDVAAARLLAGKRETAAWLADALGALAVFAPAATERQGLALSVGRGPASRVVLEPTGSANAFRLDGHAWRIERDASGAAAGIKRDGAAPTLASLPTARVAVTDGTSWKGAGLVFARLAGAPKVAISAGPRVRLVGSGVADAITTPAPDDFTLDADLHFDGAPAGIAARVVPGGSAFQGVSLLVVPGTPPHAALVVADGSGNETAMAPAVEVTAPMTPTIHARLVLKGRQLSVTLGTAGATVLTATLPDDLTHGDLALRAYPGATLEVAGWQLSTGRKR